MIVYFVFDGEYIKSLFELCHGIGQGCVIVLCVVDSYVSGLRIGVELRVRGRYVSLCRVQPGEYRYRCGQ